MIHTAIILLGSNINKERNLSLAVQKLAGMVELVDVSAVYETLPVGTADQANFLNAAVMIRTDLSPAQLKRGPLSEIERDLKRVRQTDKNAPRTIDLDITWFDDATLDYRGPDGQVRHIPDPDLRRFPHIAVPVAELLPADTLYPGTAETIASIATRLSSAAALSGEPRIWPRTDLDLRQYLPPDSAG